ncbi:synaptonemal complex protein 3 [Cricetulus griseus]|uniref:Synaptonemal complex protein 3 n=1 Tax=Cricetulus griseus TaxID=10029 RepID=A0A061HYJ5_CRIGR|nr:synaptonemal complex protein 3 [Cricetulus griseus]
MGVYEVGSYFVVQDGLAWFDLKPLIFCPCNLQYLKYKDFPLNPKRKYTGMFPHARRDSEEPEGTPVEGEPLLYNFEDEEQELSASQRSYTQELSSASDSHGKKSPIELFVDVGEKVEVILGKLGGDINRALNAKRQRMEANTRESFEGIDQKMKQAWNSHEDAVAKLNEDSAQSFVTLFEQWNLDFQKFREKHEKLMNDFQHEEKIFQQCRLIQNQRLRTIKHVHEQFLKNLEDLEKKNDMQFLSTQNELKEEMNKLRRKIMKESQQQEMVNVRQSLQSMLF